ncbi:tetratricopeptide repeat protein [Empedobacter brevis]
MPKSFIFFPFTLCAIFIMTSFSPTRKNEDLILLEYVINQNREITDSVQLQHSFKTLQHQSTHFIAKNLEIIYQVYLANIYAKNFDKLNPKSDLLYRNAEKAAKNLGLIDMQIWVNTQYGYYYYSFSQYQNAYPYFMEASKLLEQTNETQIFQKSDVYKKNAFFFMNVKELDKSEKYLQSALKYTNKKNKEYGTILNAIGHISLEKKNFSKANDYFNLTKKYALQNNDRIRYAKALGDIAAIHIHNKQYELAIDLLKKDIQISKEENNLRNLMYANIKLGELYLTLNRIDAAEEILKEAKNYASQKSYLSSFEYDIYLILLDIAIKKNNTTAELDARRKLSELENRLKKTDGENVINEINWNIQKDNFNYKYEAEKAKSEKATLLKNTLILVACLLLIIILFVFISFKRKIKIQNSVYDNKVLKLQNEKLKSENRLSKAKQTLDSYKTYLTEKNKQIEILNKEINNTSGLSKIEEQHGKLTTLLDSHLMTDENWNNFKNVFNYEQKEFVKHLNQHFPSLTESNLRIIYLLKLELNNVEIAQLLGITTDAVKKAKQRLRKKYENYDYIFHHHSNEKK